LQSDQSSPIPASCHYNPGGVSASDQGPDAVEATVACIMDVRSVLNICLQLHRKIDGARTSQNTFC